MFTLALDPTYTATVRGELPGGLTFDFEATFRRLSTGDLKAIDKSIADGATDEMIVARVLADWRGVTDESGTELTFSASNLAAVLNVHGVARAILRAFYESLSEGRRKN